MRDIGDGVLEHKDLAAIFERCRVRCSRKGRRSRPGRRETVLFDVALAPCPAGASGNPAATAPDHVFNIEFASWTGVEAFLDCRL